MAGTEERIAVKQKRISSLDETAFVVKPMSGLYQSKTLKVRKHSAKPIVTFKRINLIIFIFLPLVHK